jgi:hypothetical protein
MAAAVSERPVKVLALLPFSEEAASVRFRVLQFLPFLTTAGFDVETHALIDTDAFRLLYKRGHKLEKVAALVSSTSNRIRALRRNYDLALIHREAYPLGQPVIERWLARRVPMVFDFDDAIYLQNASDANREVSFLKRPAKTAEIVALSTAVIAGNAHLGEYARRYSPRVTVIPTCVDTSVWAPLPRPSRSGPPVIGWIGTPTTTPYLLALQPVFEALARATPFILRISGSGTAVSMPVDAGRRDRAVRVVRHRCLSDAHRRMDARQMRLQGHSVHGVCGPGGGLSRWRQHHHHHSRRGRPAGRDARRVAAPPDDADRRCGSAAAPRRRRPAADRVGVFTAGARAIRYRGVRRCRTGAACRRSMMAAGGWSGGWPLRVVWPCC